MYKTASPTAAQKLLFAFSLLLCALLLCCPQAAAQGVKNGISLCTNTLIASLFPFLFACDLMLHALFAAFPKLPAAAAHSAAWLMGQLGGFVAGAKALSLLYKQQRISAKDASLYLCGCVNAGPAFAISAVGAGMFGELRAGLCLFAALQLASLVCFLAARCFCERQTCALQPTHLPAASLSDSISASLKATANICAAAILFSCIVSLADAALPFLPNACKLLLSMVLEVSSGCAAAAKAGGAYGLYAAAAAISFGGLSVAAQLRTILHNTEISLFPFLLSRLVHLPLSLFFLCLTLQLLPPDTPAWTSARGDTLLPFCVSPTAALALFGMCCCALMGHRMISPLYERHKKGV